MLPNINELRTIERAKDALIRNYKYAMAHSLTPAKTVDLLSDDLGKGGAADIIAAMIVAHGAWDQRISEANHTWAAGRIEHSKNEFSIVGVFYCDEIHPVHMDQLADAVRRALKTN